MNVNVCIPYTCDFHSIGTVCAASMYTSFDLFCSSNTTVNPFSSYTLAIQGCLLNIQSNENTNHSNRKVPNPMLSRVAQASSKPFTVDGDG